MSAAKKLLLFLSQYKFSHGEKIDNSKEGEEDSTTKLDSDQEQATEHADEPAEEDRSGGKQNRNGNRFTPKFGKNNSNSKESEVDTEKPAQDSETRPESPSSRPKLFSTSERAPSHFVPKVKQNADGSTTTTTSTTLTTSTTTVASASADETTRKKTFGKDLLSSIPIEDDVSALLPAGFVLQPETSSVGIVQVGPKPKKKYSWH